MTEPVGSAPSRPAGPTPSQTVGPYLHIVLPWADGPDVVAPGTPGSFLLTGRVTDGAGEPVPDGLVEIWQADPDGRFAHPDDPRGAVSRPGFRGFGRCPTDSEGRFGFVTVKPGPLPDDRGGTGAPHIDVSVFARGLLNRVVTRIYFPDEDAANAADPVLTDVGPERAPRLVARAVGDGLVFDVSLQGPTETPFFDV